MRYAVLLLVCVACSFPRPEQLPDAAATPPTDASSGTALPDAAPMDFAVALAAPKIRVVEGSSATLEVVISRNAFSDPVSVTVAGLPTGVTADPLTIDKDRGTLTVHSALEATQGEATLTITALGAGRAHDAALALLTMGLPGTPDRSFAAGNVVSTGIAGSGVAIAVQPDGKVLALSKGIFIADTVLLARYLSDGTPDVSFSGGTVLVDKGFAAMALQPDGKILLAGSTVASPPRGLVARLNIDGMPDDSFGDDGKIQLDLSKAQFSRFTSLTAVAVQNNGGIMVAGQTNIDSAGQTEYHGVVARLTPIGKPDPTFGPGGSTTTGLGTLSAGVRTLALQADGKLIAAGRASGPNSSELVVFARFTEAGALDSTFSGDGILATDVGFIDSLGYGSLAPVPIALQSDGKIVAAGSATSPLTSSGQQYTFLLRLNGNDGSPDASFGTNGVKFVKLGNALNDNTRGLAIQSDGKLIIVGSALVDEQLRGSVVRFSSDTLLDLGFAGGVVVPFQVSPATGSTLFHSIAIDAEGRVVAAGGLSTADSEHLIITRLWP